jgi:hypothetical protein
MKPFQSWTLGSTKITPFQSRVVAAWIVALPIAYAMNVSVHQRVAQLVADPKVFAAAELRKNQHASFVGFFIFLFIGLFVVTFVIDALANLILRLFPDHPRAAKPSA